MTGRRPDQPSANVEIVREVMTLFGYARSSDTGGEQATRRLRELISPDIHIDMSRRVFNPDTYDGYEGLARLGREMQSVWGEFTITPERFVDVDDRVVVIEIRRGRGRASGVEVEQRSGVIWTLQNSQIVRMETDLDPNAALEVVGRSE
jgi:ketosteroid isomerase-like protein